MSLCRKCKKIKVPKGFKLCYMCLLYLGERKTVNKKTWSERYPGVVVPDDPYCEDPQPVKPITHHVTTRIIK